MEKKRYHLNAPGDFYVEDDSCIICMNPEEVAGSLMGFYEDNSNSPEFSHCYFKKQPENPEELELAKQAVFSSCCGALRYAGTDPEVISDLKSKGVGFCCDNLEETE